MPRPPRHPAAPRSVTALVVLVAVVGCGQQRTAAGGGDEPSTWVTTGDPLPTGVVTWASGGVVRVGDVVLDSDTGTAIDEYVVAGDAAWVVADDSDELLRVTADGATATGSHVDPDSLLASPDGRWLGFLDPESGERDRYDTPLLQAVVVDLQTGEEVLRSSAGMGDPAEDDLADLYEDASYGLVALDDTTAHVAPAAGEGYAVDLAAGTVTETGDELTYADDESPANADGSWRIRHRGDRGRFVAADGQVVELDEPLPTVLLDRWLDATTAVGFAGQDPLASGEQDPATVVSLVTCTVPTGACTSVPGAEAPRDDLLLPHRSTYALPGG